MNITSSLGTLALVSVFVSPAFAAKPPVVATPLESVSPSCGSGDLTGSGFTVIDCSGYYKGNLINSNASDQLAVNGALTALGLSGTGGTYLEKLDISSGTTIDFGTILNGIVYLGIHRGGANNGSQGTAFYELSVSSNPVFTFTLGGLSNAALYGNNGSVPPTSVVPEPETYALMLAGLGVVGFTAARRKNV